MCSTRVAFTARGLGSLVCQGQLGPISDGAHTCTVQYSTVQYSTVLSYSRTLVRYGPDRPNNDKGHEVEKPALIVQYEVEKPALIVQVQHCRTEYITEKYPACLVTRVLCVQCHSSIVND